MKRRERSSRPERVEQHRLGREFRRSPGAPAGGAPLGRVDERQVVAIGHQCEGNAVVAA